MEAAKNMLFLLMWTFTVILTVTAIKAKIDDRKHWQEMHLLSKNSGVKPFDD